MKLSLIVPGGWLWYIFKLKVIKLFFFLHPHLPGTTSGTSTWRLLKQGRESSNLAKRTVFKNSIRECPFLGGKQSKLFKLLFNGIIKEVPWRNRKWTTCRDAQFYFTKSSVYFLGPHRTARVLWNRLQIYAPRLRCSPASVRAQAWAKRRMDGWRALGYPIGVEDQMKEISIRIINKILWTYQIVR